MRSHLKEKNDLACVDVNTTGTKKDSLSHIVCIKYKSEVEPPGNTRYDAESPSSLKRLFYCILFHDTVLFV
jgi:hypothetical protein